MTDQQEYNIDHNQDYQQNNYGDPGVDMNDLPMEMQYQDVNRNNMQSYMGLGFDKKMRQIKPKISKTNLEQSQQNGNNYNSAAGGAPQDGNQNLQDMRQKQFGTLDAKAYLVMPSKGLNQYQSKTGVDFLSNDQIKNGKPIQMISYDEQDGTWRLTEQAIECIASVNGPVSFVSIYGQSYSGKSFLMNQILKTTQKDRFVSGSHDDNTTKGIIMWNTPSYNSQTHSYIFFLDTQEFQKDPGQRDFQSSILFFITSLISQTMMVNVVGQLGPNSFSPLQDLHQLNEFIQIDSPEQKEELGNIFPRILYVLRDHDGNVRENGQNVAIHTHFDNFLFSDDEYHKASQVEQKVRRRIVKYLRQRDAVSLTKPVQDDEKLENLDNLQETDLDSKFQDEIKGLRKKLFYHSRKKEYRGVVFTPTILISFINSIIEDINNREKIDLNKAFCIMVENEFIFIYNQSIDMYNLSLKNSFKDELPFLNFYQIQQILRDARSETYDNFYKLRAFDMEIAEQHFENYFERLTQYINSKEEEILQHNNQQQLSYVQKHVSEEQQQIQRLTDNGQFSVDDLKLIKDRYQTLIQKVLGDCLGTQTEQNPLHFLVCTVQNNLSNQFIQEIEQQKDILSKQEQDKLAKMRNETNNKVSEMNKAIDNEKNMKSQLDKKNREQIQRIQQLEQQLKQAQKQSQDQQAKIQQQDQKINELEGQKKELAAKLKSKCC